MEDIIRICYDLTPERHFCKDCKYSQKEKTLKGGEMYSPICTKEKFCVDFSHGIISYTPCIVKNKDGLCNDFEQSVFYKIKSYIKTKLNGNKFW